MTMTLSLRGKILLLLVGTVLMIAVFVAALSERDITQTVSERETHAVRNTVELISLNIATRWSALLDDKIRMVRSERAQLMEAGALVRATLESHAREAQNALLKERQAVARDWVDRLSLENQRQIWIYDQDNRIISSTDAALIGQDISGLLDIKGRPLAEAMREESREFGHGFTIHDAETARGKETRFAHFGYFAPWNWVVAVSDSAQAITEQVESKKAALEAEIQQTLSPLVLAQSGFVFIVTDEGRFIVPPPETQRKQIEALGPDFLSAQARQKNGGDEAVSPRAFRVSTGKEIWQVEAAYFRPLAWTLVAMVPETDLTLPARQLMDRQAVLSVVILCLSLLCAFLFAARIARPLAQLTQFARALPEQDFLSDDHGIPAHIAALPEKSRDEIGHLAAAFLFMARRLRENIQRLVFETSARERIESELDIARSIQLGLLPLPLPDSLSPFLNLKAHMLPAREVGGDIYDYFMISAKEMCLVIGDVSGKGVPAALFMAITRTLIRSAARDETDPGKMMESVNDRLAENNPNLMFVTLFLGILNIERRELRYVNAGHPPAIRITREGRTFRLEGRSGPACGVQEQIRYRPLLAHLEPGDTLIGYTDGVTEAIDGKGAQYGEARLLKTLGQPAKSAEETVNGLLADIEAFTAGMEPFDDITLIAAQLRLPEKSPAPFPEQKTSDFRLHESPMNYNDAPGTRKKQRGNG
ncbi:MAG: SpoIIE family protein phosphatase [Zoogloeaceae bacterium]|jgi:sigma-B regulation protein RsbU (phosphoserine phosphatase)|nr:SpoIIE family protein phosphatase [Zoogloeaceae bacterium]